MKIHQNTSVAEIVDFIQKLNPTTVALSGGNTPKPLYQALTGTKYDFYQVDERYVPHDDPDSNHKMINDCGLKLRGYFDTRLSIPECLTKYDEQLPRHFDLTILGIGHDGHTASLFPNQEPSFSSVAHTKAPATSPITDRLTITFPTILASKHLIILLHNKPQILAELQNPTKNPHEFPALKLLQHKELSIFELK